jgi:hypothetical protein
VAGYTIAYVFRLADIHARGRQRYYALLALAGTDTQRAFEACTVIWSLFEQIAMHIVRSAEQVAARCSSSLEDSPPERRGQITPISSFLTGRTMDPDGYPRRGGMGTVRANGIAELVDNENFFCELHLIFVGMLQELGRLLGGMRVKPQEKAVVAAATHNGFAAVQDTQMAQANGHAVNGHHRHENMNSNHHEDQDETRNGDSQMRRNLNHKPFSSSEVDLPAKTISMPMRSASSDDVHENGGGGRCPTPLYSPRIVAQRHQVVV